MYLTFVVFFLPTASLAVFILFVQVQLRDYLCPTCLESFCTESDLLKHQLEEHTLIAGAGAPMNLEYSFPCHMSVFLD